MDLHYLCRAIGLPGEVAAAVLDREPLLDRYRSRIRDLARPDLAEAAHRELAQLLQGDDMTMLACQLEAAVLCRHRLLKLGIPQRIILDTMKCFTRFLEETHAMTGQWKFDRDWWTWRQTGGLLLRIGQLEYELCPGTGEVSLHIPSDAVFTPEQVELSLEAAGLLIDRFFPEYAGAARVCHSWLLSPTLKELLPENSNILCFQRRFTLTQLEPENTDAIGWIFCTGADTPVRELPEDTTLRANAKKLLLAGGNIGAAGGILN